MYENSKICITNLITSKKKGYKNPHYFRIIIARGKLLKIFTKIVDFYTMIYELTFLYKYCEFLENFQLKKHIDRRKQFASESEI